MTIWDAFHARHGRKNFTPAFNDHLEALIADDNAELSDRLRALILRRAWGNHSDCCVNDEGVVMGQADCARELNVTRQQANPFFQSLARGNYVRIKGREIHPVDNPFEGEAGFADSSPSVEPFRTDSEEEANIDREEPTESAEGVSFEDFIEQVWSREDPIGYQSYQEVAKSFKAWRIDLLAKYKAYERGAKVGEPECPKGSDNASERVGQPVRKGRTNEDRIIITENRKQKTSSSSTPTETTTTPKPSLGKIAAALGRYGTPDDQKVRELIQNCRREASDCTDDEIVHFVEQKAKLLSRSIQYPIAFLCKAVPKCFEGESFRHYRQERKREEDRQAAVSKEAETWSNGYEPQIRPEPVKAAPALAPERAAQLEKSIAELTAWLEEHPNDFSLGRRLERKGAQQELKNCERELGRRLRSASAAGAAS